MRQSIVVFLLTALTVVQATHLMATVIAPIGLAPAHSINCSS